MASIMAFIRALVFFVFGLSSNLGQVPNLVCTSSYVTMLVNVAIFWVFLSSLLLLITCWLSDLLRDLLIRLFYFNITNNR